MAQSAHLLADSATTDDPSVRPANILAALPNRVELDLPTSEAAWSELLLALKRDQLPQAARAGMLGAYGRYLRRQTAFLHRFAPFLCESDQLFHSRTTPHLLDLGCGVASDAHLLGIRGQRVTGLDRNPQRIATGQAMKAWFEDRSGMPLQTSLHAVDAFDWLARQEPDSFDGCLSQFSLAYMKPYRQMFRLIDRVVKPGGLIVFRSFNGSNLFDCMVSRVNWLTADDYVAMGKQLDWTPVSQQFCWFLPEMLLQSGWTRRICVRFESHLAHLTPTARLCAKAMTLTFRRKS